MLRQELLSAVRLLKIKNMGIFGTVLAGVAGKALGSTAFSSLSGQVNQSLSAHRNARLDFETWKKKFDYSYEMNSPLAQRRRLEAAGLNPALMYQGGTGAGLSTSIGQSSVTGQNVDTTAMASIMNQTKVADAEANKLNAEADEIRRNTSEGNATFPIRFEQLKDQAQITQFERQVSEVTARFAEQNAEEQLKLLVNNVRIAGITADKLDIDKAREEIRDKSFVTIDVNGQPTSVPLSIAPFYLEISSVVQQIETLKEQTKHWKREDWLRASELALDTKRFAKETINSVLGFIYRGRELDISQQDANTRKYEANTKQKALEHQAWLDKEELVIKYESLNREIAHGNWDRALKSLDIIAGMMPGVNFSFLYK